MAPSFDEKRDAESIEKDHKGDSSSSSDLEAGKKEAGQQGTSTGTESQWNERPQDAGRGGSLAALSQRRKSASSQHYVDGKRVLQQNECYDALGFTWPSWKKVCLALDKKTWEVGLLTLWR